MLTRRIATGACALCLAIPAAAGASEGTSPPGPQGPDRIAPAGPPSTVKARGPYGNAPAGPPSSVKARGPYGNLPAGPRSSVRARGPYGSPAAGPPSTVKAAGPYGIPPGTGSQITTAASMHGSGTSPRDDTNGWRTAAISEAALLAAVLLGWALLLPARRRAAHMVT
jgi:hypothetical protein